MKMDKIAGSGKDEFYTPYYAIKPLLKYLKPNSTIWCPFDTEQSLFVKVLEGEGHTVVYTHKDMIPFREGDKIFNGDFFVLAEHINLDQIDYIISNPPYSMKNEVLETLFSLNKPFAMLLGVVGLFESKKRFNLFKNNNFETMYFDKRVSYCEDYDDFKPSLNPPFSSIYLTQDVLPNKMVFEEIDKKEINYE